MTNVPTAIVFLRQSVALLVLVITMMAAPDAWGQTKGPDRNKYKDKHKLKKKAPKLPPSALKGNQLKNAKFNFKAVKLKGLKENAVASADALAVAAAPVNNALPASLVNPTSLQFGPDGKLYVSQQNGLIKVLTIV